LLFSLGSIADLSRFGIRIFLAGMSDTIFSRLDVFIIGKLFPIQLLGFYNRSQSLDGLVRNFSASTTTSVAFPVFAKMANDDEAVRSFYRRCLNVISFLAFLLIGVLFLTCFDIVVILFTETWRDVGSFFRIMAVTGFIYPISALMVNLIAGRGNSGAYLKLELLKKCVLYPAYLSFIFGGIYLFLVSLGAAYFLALWLNAYFVGKEIEITVKEQLWAIYKYGIIALIGTSVVFVATYSVENIYIHFLTASGAYGAIYLLFCYRFRLSGFMEIYDRTIGYYDAKRNPNLSAAA
jgi:teichuronic acid exporter